MIDKLEEFYDRCGICFCKTYDLDSDFVVWGTENNYLRVICPREEEICKITKLGICKVSKLVNIEDKVTSKKTGLPSIGIVINIFHPSFYLDNVGKIVNHKMWDKFYPNWRTKYVIGVGFDKSQKPYTIQELAESYEIDPKGEIAKFIYDKMTPEANTIFYPIDDLELVED